MRRTAIIISGKSATHMPGGLGAYAMNMAQIMRGMDYQVVMVGLGPRNELFEQDGIEFLHIRTPFNWLTGLGVPMLTPFFLRAIECHLDLERLKGAIVIGMATWNFVGIRLKQRYPECGIRTLSSCFTTHAHELWGHIRGAPVTDYGLTANLKYRLAYLLDRLLIRYSDRIALTQADRIIIHYHSTRRIMLADYLAIDPDQIRQIPYCVELYRRNAGSEPAPTELEKSRPWVVAICRQDPRKGINSLIKAVAQLRGQRDFVCIIVGSGPFLADNRALARRLGLDAPAIRFTGFVADIRPYLRQADLYVLPSLEEGSGAISLLEAMKLGVPIVTTRCDGIPEDFTHERNALLAEMDDPDDLARQIASMLDDQALRSRLAAQAKADYAARFRFDAMAAAMKAIIEEMEEEK